MRILIQRVDCASVEVNEKIKGKINQGLLLFVGFNNEDDESVLDKMIDKTINLRIFNDDNNNLNLSLLDVKGDILSISQFTLYANCKKGRRPSFTNSKNYEEAENLYLLFNKKLKERNLKVETGCFGKEMSINLINSGPTTIILDSKEI